MTDFPEKVHKLMRSVHRKIIKILFTPLKDAGITPPQLMVLRSVVKSDGSVTVGDVCKALNTPLSNATNICARLESAGLLRRERDKRDRRRVVLTVTDNGKAAIGAASVAYDKLNESMDAAFDAKQKENIFCGFEMLDGWLKNYLDAEKQSDD